MVALHTPRLLMRPLQERDADAFAALNADPEVMAHFPSTLDAAASRTLMHRLQEGFEQHGFGWWALELKEDGTLAGVAGLSVPSFQAPFTPCVEVGWRLARHAWGHGYAREAAREALRFGLDVKGLEEILSFTVPANTRSRRVMEALGMLRDQAADFDHPRLPEGHALRRHVLYRMTRARWRESINP